MARAWLAAAISGVALVSCTGSFGGSCTVRDSYFCLDFTGTGYAASDVQAACAQASGLLDGGPGVYASGPCATDNRLGTCTRNPGTMRELVESDYAGGPRTAPAFQALCGGIWTP
jgi:hypothetical protein